MEFHEMKRKDLQALCKKHGVPANLKNSEMANRLASLLQKESEEIVTESNEDSVDGDDVKSKKVSFSPETEVFEFTRSVKKRRQTKNVRSRRSQGSVRDLQEENGIELRRSKRIGSSGTTQEGSEVTEVKDLSKGLFRNVQDGSKVETIGRRFTRSRSNRLVETNNKEDVTVEVQETGKLHGKDVEYDAKVEKVARRSKRFVNDIEDRSKEERKSKQLKGSVNSQEGEEPTENCGSMKAELVTRRSKRHMNKVDAPLVDENVKAAEVEKAPKHGRRLGKREPLIDCEVQSTEMVTRRSKRHLNKVDAPLVDENVKAVEVEKAPKQSRPLGKNVSELLLDGQAQKGDKKLKRTSGNDHEDMKLLRRSKRSALDNTMGQAMINSPSRCLVIDSQRDEAPVDEKSNENDEMKVRVRCTRKYSKNGSSKAVKVGKKKDEILVKSSKRVNRRMKPDVSAEQGIDVETASPQDNLMPEEHLDEHAQFDQEEAGVANVEASGSSKKSKTMIQDCIENKPQETHECSSPSSTETKAAESVMIVENVLDSTEEKEVDRSQKTSTQELDSELMEGECEEKLEQDTVLMAVLEKEKEEVSSRSVHLTERLSPGSEQLAESSHEAELLVLTGHTLLKDVASKMTVEENTKSKDTFVSTPRREHKEQSSVSKLAKLEAKEVQAHGKVNECNTENSSDEEEMEITIVGCMSIAHCVNLTPEKLVDEYTQLEPEEGKGTNVEVRSSSKKMAEDSPSTFETKVTEPVMISENALEDSSLVKSTQELHSEVKERECEDKHEQDSVLRAGTKKEKEETSSLRVVSAEEQAEFCMVGCISGGQYVNLQTLDEVKDATLEKSERMISSDEGFKLNAEISGWSSPDFASPSSKEENISECFEKDETEDLSLSQPLLANKAASSELDESAVFTTPEKNLMLMEQLRENGKTCAVDSVTHHSDEGKTTILKLRNRFAILQNSVPDVIENSGGNRVMKFYEEPVVFSGLEEKHELFGDSGEDRAVKTEEKAAVESRNESDVPKIPFPEGSQLVEDAKSEEAAELCFTTAEKHSLLETDEGDKITDKSNVVSDVCPESLMRDYIADVTEEKYRENNDVFSSPDRRKLEFKDESAFASSSKAISKDDDSNSIADSSGEQETAVPKGPQTENVASLNSTQGTSKQTRAHSPHLDSVNLFDFEIEEAETINEAEVNASLSPYVLALPALATTCETISETFNHLEVAATYSGEGINSSTNIQNQISNALEEMSITDNNEVDDELTEPKATNSTQILTEQVISLTPNEEAREVTPSPEQQLDKDLNIDDESSKLSEKEVKREPISIYTATQVKTKRHHHDIKENALNSKVVDNLNVTAPRTSKRKPLQDLKNN